ncbi:MAG: TIGR00730 family Rossman fold protein [Proteobacteria bacterium]|nr:TIGR00730 family Rossman fold protein [Pseudomonadota bacterium]
MGTIRNVCVYCGSSSGHDPDFVAAAAELGAILARKKIGLVFGGGSLGMMGAVAAAAADNNGQVTAIIPDFLQAREHTFRRAQEIVVTRGMHERKRKMFERSDAFVALPGGVGTLEELIEQLTWVQLGRHRKPVLLANLKHFWDPLIALFGHMKSLGYMQSGGDLEYLTAARVADIVPALEAAVAPVAEAELRAGAERIERF